MGIQAQEVHNSTVYQVLPDAPADRKYEVGLNYLEAGVPAKALELIGEAIAHGFENAEVRFHWVLAMLSKRSFLDLSPGERQRLDDVRGGMQKYTDDEWKRALRAVCELLACLDESQGDPRSALAELHALPDYLRSRIVRHLDLVLTGGMKDSLWADSRQAAANARFSGDRRNRVWAFFHPDPIGPRVRRPVPDTSTSGDRIAAVWRSGLFAAAVLSLGVTVLADGAVVAVLAFLVTVAAGTVAVLTGLEWSYSAQRLKTKERELFGPAQLHQAPDGGFANRVDHYFSHYFSKYVPRDTDRGLWLANTSGVRMALRDEIVELYRESRIGVDRVEWLIRHMVSDVRRRWESGTLLEHRERYKVDPSRQMWCSIALVVLAPAALLVVVSALAASPLFTILATVVAAVTGRGSAKRWLHIIGERRRAAEDVQDRQRLLGEREAAYQRWKQKLDALRPSDSEMEVWLNCDKTKILDEALIHYGLAWHDILAHAFLQTPAGNHRRARVKGGPWRYSQYDIRLFLITNDGVREVYAELDFVGAALNAKERNNYRFDAVSSVRYSETDAFSYTLTLILNNGPTRNIRVTAPEYAQPELNEDLADLEALSRINLDAAGFAHTLHILEGIAAEGKEWINRAPSARNLR
ncbi:hypothetical protein FZ103_12335 [Streptomonospora sp. PA3]|uniref:hypothetical protein n=1 Tax=Streptomonospora sp. PA3 TaxID=2607326 RepID=UPI0012DCE23F|nr:hypothetical protein [Streptomonospora sp. PA3]MUL41952.1 hypothetical protein [Streptomonospora sp. PA3]